MKNTGNFLINQEKELYKSERTHFLQEPWAKAVFVLFCISADAYTLFNIIDLMLKQSPELTYFITAVVAATLNVIPMFIAACLRSDNLGGMKKTLCIVLAAAFAVIFLGTFTLRMSTADQMYSDDSNLTTTGYEYTDEAETEGDKTGHSFSQYALLFLLGMEPLATSICAFYISYEGSPEKKKKLAKTVSMIKIQDELDRLEVESAEIQADLDYDLEGFDRQCCEATQKIMRAEAELMKASSRRILSETVGTPEGVSYLTEGGWKKDQNNNGQEEPVPAV